MTAPIRVVLAEDHAVVAHAIATMLSYEEGIRVLAVTPSGTEVIEAVADLHPDVVLMDVGLRGLNGIEATRTITRSHPETGVVMLTMHEDEDTIAQAIGAGARGFLPKNAPPEDLLEAVRNVAQGNAFISPAMLALFLRRVAPLAEEAVAPERLTDREQEVLRHLTRGMSTKQIAGALFVGEETVKTHLTHIYQKLGVSDRLQAVVVAIRQGLVPG